MTGLAPKTARIRSRAEPATGKRVVDTLTQGGLPKMVKIPNSETIAAMNEARVFANPRFKSAQQMFDDLEK